MDVGRAAISSLWMLPAATTTEETHAPGAGATTEERQTLSFDALYQYFYPRVLAFLRFRTGMPDVAEDLTSLVFERALLHFDDLHVADAAGAWLFRIARNCASDYFRRRRQEVSLDMLIEGDHGEHPLARSAEEAVLVSEEYALLLAHLSRLSEREREVIGLKFVACLHNAEIARVLHIPPGTVGSILHRALGRLRDALYAESERR